MSLRLKEQFGKPVLQQRFSLRVYPTEVSLALQPSGGEVTIDSHTSLQSQSEE
jgi:hypothetical protein